MNPPFLLAACLLLVMLTSGVARADEPAPESARSAAPACSPAPAPSTSSASRAELRNVFRGIVLLGVGFDSGHFGAAVRVVAGAQWIEIRTLRDRRFVLRWNGFVRGTAGILGNTAPLLAFVGAALDLDGEAGIRLSPRSTWSPYVGAGGAFRLSVVALPAVPMSRYDTINDPRGVAGVNGAASVRVSMGASDVGAHHALHLTAFVQESARAPETFARTDAFTELGVRAQFDVPANVQLVVEGSFGWAPAETDPIFHGTDRGMFLEASFSARKLIRHRSWLGLDAYVAQRRDRTTYESGLTYGTRDLLSTAFLLSWGFVL